MDSAAPTKRAAIMRGSRISQTIEYTAGEAALTGKIFDNNAIITSAGDRGYRPIRKEIKNKKIGRATMTVVRGIFCQIFLYIAIFHHLLIDYG